MQIESTGREHHSSDSASEVNFSVARIAVTSRLCVEALVYGVGGSMIPGEIQTAPGEIELNAGRKTIAVSVANTGDRPIQVGSHYHFYETNEALAFDRPKAYGFRLNIPAGTA